MKYVLISIFFSAWHNYTHLGWQLNRWLIGKVMHCVIVLFLTIVGGGQYHYTTGYCKKYMLHLRKNYYLLHRSHCVTMQAIKNLFNHLDSDAHEWTMTNMHATCILHTYSECHWCTDGLRRKWTANLSFQRNASNYHWFQKKCYIYDMYLLIKLCCHNEIIL